MPTTDTDYDYDYDYDDDEDDSCPGCDDCRADDDDDYPDLEALNLRSYDYKPTPLFMGKGPLYVGVEVETAVKSTSGVLRETLDEMTRGYTRLYVKSDSTVPGFELVSHPFNPADFLAGHLDDRLPFGKLDDLVEAGAIYRHHETTGLHVHISRDAFTAAHLMRFLEVHHYLRRVCGVVGGRGTDNNWGTFDSTERTSDRRHKAEGGNGKSRYEAVNTHNYSTIELRYPRGDSTYSGVATMVEWVLAIYRYTDPKRVTAARFLAALKSPDDLVQWVKTNAATYPRVWGRLAAAGYGRKG